MHNECPVIRKFRIRVKTMYVQRITVKDILRLYLIKYQHGLFISLFNYCNLCTIYKDNDINRYM